MSNSLQKEETMEDEAHVVFIPGSTDAENNNTFSPEVRGMRRVAASWCKDKDKDYRKLAICSIICGISCIGIKALINSVKAEETSDPAIAAEYSKRAKKFGIISIVTWVAILALTPMLIGLISYLLTLQD